MLDQLEDYFGKDVYSCLDYVEKDWTQEPYSVGGPVCTMPPGTMPCFAKAIRQPFERCVIACCSVEHCPFYRLDIVVFFLSMAFTLGVPLWM